MILRDHQAERLERVRPVWTEEKIRALGVRTDLVTACQIVYGCGKNRAWEMFHADQLDFPAVRCGRRVVVPVAPLLALMFIGSETNSDPGHHPRAAATNHDVPAPIGDPDASNVRRLRAAAAG